MYNQLVIKPLFVSFILLTIITGIIYPALVTLIGNVLFSEEVNGSLVTKEGRIVGSKLIGQSFSSAKYFWSRPSATSPIPYNIESSSGSNLSISNPALIERVDKLVKVYGVYNNGPIPLDLVTASGSGLDPHISYASAVFQMDRILAFRSISKEKLKSIIDENLEGGMFEIINPKRINVLKLNMALDAAEKR